MNLPKKVFRLILRFGSGESERNFRVAFIVEYLNKRMKFRIRIKKRTPTTRAFYVLLREGRKRRELLLGRNLLRKAPSGKRDGAQIDFYVLLREGRKRQEKESLESRSCGGSVISLNLFLLIVLASFPM